MIQSVSIPTSVIVIDGVELVVEIISDSIKLLIVIDGDENLLTVLLTIQAQDHVTEGVMRVLTTVVEE